MPTFRTIALSIIAILALAVTFALGCYTASHKSRLDLIEQDAVDTKSDIARHDNRLLRMEERLESLEAWRSRFGHGQGAAP